MLLGGISVSIDTFIVKINMYLDNLLFYYSLYISI